jgi:serine O-acetyltransferase
MTFKEYRELLAADLYRHGGRRGWRNFLHTLFWGEGDNFSFWFRTCVYLRSHRWLKYTLFPLAKLRFRAAGFRLGVSIPYATRVGRGLCIAHVGGIVVSHLAVIGRDCTIAQGVTLGFKPGAKPGAPTIGNEVYIGPGAKVIGAVHVGDRAVIGANAVVTSDVEPGSVVAGIPARPIGRDRADDYVINRSTDIFGVAG